MNIRCLPILKVLSFCKRDELLAYHANFAIKVILQFISQWEPDFTDF